MTLRIPIAVLLAAVVAHADPPETAYVFPAGGRRGTTVDVRIGGLNLHDTARLHVRGEGVTATPVIERTETIWFEGPLIRQPASQREENYPRDYAGRFTLTTDATGPARWFVSNSQGVTTSRPFVVGDLPEIVEDEFEGDPLPVAVTLPVTINGRIFPREDVDVWTVELEAGDTVTCEVNAARIGSPLDSRLEVRGPNGRIVAENVDALENDSRAVFTAEETGRYAVRIHDVAFRGLQDHVYRLTLTDGPWIEAVHPLGGRRGERIELHPLGANLPDGPVTVTLPSDPEANRSTLRPTIAGRPAGVVTLDLGDHPKHLESVDGGNGFELPATLNGRIAVPGESDNWRFGGTKGTKATFDLRAASLGSPLDSVLTIHDTEGRVLATNDDRTAGNTDSRLTFTLPADGDYDLRVGERLASRGGPRFSYRIDATIGDDAPGFAVTLPADAITVTRGTDTKLDVIAVRRGGFDGEIALRFDGLPDGVTVEGAAIPARKPKASVVLRAADEVPVQLADVTVTAIGTIGEETVEVPVAADSAGVGPVTAIPLAVALPTPFSFAADFETKYANMGCVHARRYRLERKGYDGPITVRLADVQARHLQGVTGPTITVPPGATSFEYPVQLGPRMEVGRTSRSCILAVARVGDVDGSRHDVCFGSTAQNEQFVLLTDPPRLHVAPARASVIATPGESVELVVNVERGVGLEGPVTLVGRFAEHVRGVESAKVVVPAGEERAEIAIRFGRTPGPFNVPFVIRATTTDERGHRVIAQTEVEVVPR